MRGGPQVKFHKVMNRSYSQWEPWDPGFFKRSICPALSQIAILAILTTFVLRVRSEILLLVFLSLHGY